MSGAGSEVIDVDDTEDEEGNDSALDDDETLDRNCFLHI